MKKVSNDKKTKKVYLPLPIIVMYALLLATLVLALLFVGPIAIDYLRHYLYSELYSPDLIVLVFFIILILIIFLIVLMIAMNERLRRRNNEMYSTLKNTSVSTYSKLNPDRSYLEQQIAELSDKLLSTQRRWEEVNHLIISSHNKNINNNGEISPTSFLENFNVDPSDFSVDKRLVFVLNPFHEDYISDYKIIKSTCSDLGFNTLRGDEEHIKGDILSHIIKCIIKSRIVIANINGRNPNVFYELGIAHTMNKPTVLISHVENDIPFDLKTQFVIIYKDEKELEEKLKELLLQILID